MLIKLNRKFVNKAFGKYFSTAAFDSKKDYYKILGIDKTANEAQIKSAYYKLAMKFHPDHNKGNQAKFKQINQAYSVLSNAQTRKQYQSQKNSGSNQNFNNFNRGTTYSYDPYRDFRNQGTYNNQSYQWQNTQWQNNQRQNRSYYENPYDAYDRFRQQYQQMDRQKMDIKQKQYEQYLRQQQQFGQQALGGFKKMVRVTFLIGLFLSFLIFFTPGQRTVYVDPNNASNYGYRVVNINGSPYLQKDPNFNPQGQQKGPNSYLYPQSNQGIYYK